jgi:hypothetical protein
MQSEAGQVDLIGMMGGRWMQQVVYECNTERNTMQLEHVGLGGRLCMQIMWDFMWVRVHGPRRLLEGGAVL